VLEKLGIEKVDGILLDIGVSSHQIDTPERGFSYMEDAPLDMRMDNRSDVDAAKILNSYSPEELSKIFRDYGEEKHAWNIAKKIVRAREEKPIETTKELIKIIDSAIPTRDKAGKGHPAKKTFQALRIEVNRELEVLENTIDQMIEVLNPGGRLCIITFHSLEDRIVKNKFKENENPCTCPPNFPQCVCGKVSKGKAVTRKPIIPSQEEIKDNKRAKSSKLRIFEKV
jgi:16S rRNA (cytosine1402-N4)-methyltransferase